MADPLLPDYWAAKEDCVVCGGTDYQPGYGPRTLVFCDCCLGGAATHIECWHAHSGELLTEDRLASPAFQWFCSEASAGVRRSGPQPAAAAAAGSPPSPPLPVHALLLLKQSTRPPPACCAQGCKRVSERLVELTGVPRPVQEAGGGGSEYR